MRPILSASLGLALLLAGCAADGVIVRKICHPQADSTMVGTEGSHAFVFRGPTGTSRLPVTVPPAEFWTWERESNERCTFLLRDQQGNVRSQLVTPEVFARYEVGDYFNDCQAAPQRRESYDDAKTVRPVIRERHSVRHRHWTAHLRKQHRSRRAITTRHHHRKSASPPTVLARS